MLGQALMFSRMQVGPMRKTGGGSIVFNGSAIAHKGYANHDVMAAAKGAVAGQPALAASPLMVPILTPVTDNVMLTACQHYTCAACWPRDTLIFAQHPYVRVPDC